MKYDFGNNVLGESLRDIFGLEALEWTKTKMSRALKHAGYAIFKKSNVMDVHYIQKSKRAKFSFYPIIVENHGLVVRPNLQYFPSITLPLYHRGCGGLSLVVYWNTYTNKPGFDLQLKLKPDGRWIPLNINSSRRDAIAAINQYGEFLIPSDIKVRNLSK